MKLALASFRPLLVCRLTLMMAMLTGAEHVASWVCDAMPSMCVI